jgi:hypothetical protein
MRESTVFTICILAAISMITYLAHGPASLTHDEQQIMDSCTFHHLDKETCDLAMQGVIDEHKRYDNAKN